MKSTLIILSNLIWLIVFLSCQESSNLKTVEKNDFTGINNLRLTGIVESIDKDIRGFHGRGIVRVRVVNSTVDNYDPRETQTNYFCLIKNGKAEIYGWWSKEAKIGDTLILDVPKRDLIYRNKEILSKADKIWIGPKDFFDHIKSSGLQKL